MFVIAKVVLAVFVTTEILFLYPEVFALTARECVEYEYPQTGAETKNLQLPFNESVVVAIRPHSASRIHKSTNEGHRGGRKEEEDEEEKGQANGTASSNSREVKEAGAAHLNLATSHSATINASPERFRANVGSSPRYSTVTGQIITWNVRQTMEMRPAIKSQEENDKRQETSRPSISNQSPRKPIRKNALKPKSTATAASAPSTARETVSASAGAVSASEGAVSAAAAPSERGLDLWRATAVIKDSSGRWCNMTISESSIEVVCSSRAHGRHGNEREEEKELFVANEWNTFIVKVLQESNTQAAPNGTQAVPEPPASNNSRTSNSSTLTLGLSGYSNYIVVAENIGLQGPMTIEWKTDASLGVVYNCWDDCDVAYRRLLSTKGPRDFYLLQENDFEGVNISYTTQGALQSSTYTLTATDFERHYKEQWMRVSLQRGLDSLKVLVDNVFLKDITNSSVAHIIGLEVSLTGGGRLTWCHKITTPSWKSPVQAISWILVGGLSILACHTFYLLLLSCKKKLGGYKEEDDYPQAPQMSSSEPECNDECVQLRKTPTTSGTSATRTRRSQNPTAGNGNICIESTNSIYYSLKKKEGQQIASTYSNAGIEEVTHEEAFHGNLEYPEGKPQETSWRIRKTLSETSFDRTISQC